MIPVVEGGATVVKFQHMHPLKAVPETQWRRLKEFNGEVMSYIAYKLSMYFDADKWHAIDDKCKEVGIPFSTSVWDTDALEDVRGFQMPFIKIPSAHLDNWKLLEACAGTGSPIVLSCGMSTEQEVDNAVAVVKDVPGTMLMHTHSAYPSPDIEQNLSMIPKMKEKYGLPVGFSSHAVSPFVPMMAAARYGADAVEVHITMDRALGGDNAASIELPGLKLLTRELKRLDILDGDGVRRVWPTEEKARLKLRGH